MFTYTKVKPNNLTLLLCCAFALAACGGDSGDSANNANQAPTKVLLSTVMAVGTTAVNIVWGAAIDDNTASTQLIYEVHIAEGGNFTPSASTLKFSGTNVLSTQVTGLKAATAYTVILVAVDVQGLRGNSSGLNVTTQNILDSTLEKLNDTGITQCAKFYTVLTDCSVTNLGDWFGLYQDGETGRDFLAVNLQLNKVGSGDAGFDFTKISAAGQKLPANAIEWSCVLDNHTGLMWEVKTDDGGLHDKDNTYQWYNQDTSTNGGTEGYINKGKNTQAFSRAINSQALCGYTDWRLPKKQELQSVVNYGKYNPTIDNTYFPNTASVDFDKLNSSIDNAYSPNTAYWSSSPFAADSNYVWIVLFINGSLSVNAKDSDNYVRLVRSEQSR